MKIELEKDFYSTHVIDNIAYIVGFFHIHKFNLETKEYEVIIWCG